MNDLSTYFGVNTAVVTPFAYENALNTLITNLDLFDVQYHTENSILLTDLIDQFVQVAGETSPYTQSSWNASKRQEWSNKLFQMKHVGSINAVTSRDLEQYSRQYPNRSDAMLVAVNDFSEAHYRSHANRVEVDLITALLGLKVESEYAGQGDLDFLDGQAKTTVPAIDFASTTVNPFLAIRKAVRLQSEKLGSGLNRPGFPGECFICELRLPDHRFRWKHNKLFLLLPEEYGPAFPAIVDCYTSPPT